MTTKKPQGPVVLIDPPMVDGHMNAPLTEVFPGFGCVTLCENGVVLKEDSTGKHKLQYYTNQILTRRGDDPSRVFTLHIEGPFLRLIYAYGSNGWTLIDKADGFA